MPAFSALRDTINASRIKDLVQEKFSPKWKAHETRTFTRSNALGTRYNRPTFSQRVSSNDVLGTHILPIADSLYGDVDFFSGSLSKALSAAVTAMI